MIHCLSSNIRFTIDKVKIRRGYTLIEILVAITIIGILFGFGYVSFRDFARRQSIAGAAKVLQGELRLAQQTALSGQKPDAGCATLDGINFRVLSSADSYIFEYVCGGVTVGDTIKTVYLPQDVYFDNPLPSPILFKVLGNGNSISSGTSVEIHLSQNGTGNRTDVTVSSGGEIK